MKKSFGLPVIAALMLACGNAAQPVEELQVFTLIQAADSVPVAIGRTVVIEGILVSFVDLLSDSRCPTTVQCVWAGDGAVRLSVGLACLRSTPACAVPELLLDLHTTLEPRAGTYAGRSIRLVALRPVPRVPGTIPRDQYVAWLQVKPVG